MKTWKRSIKIGRLFLTLSNCRVKKRNERVGDNTYKMRRMRKAFKSEIEHGQGYVCPICGKTAEKAELHHILPVCRFPEFWDDARNCVALCHDCHKEIHLNPWLNIRMMQEKAAELGLDLGERYDTRLKM